MGDRDHAHSVRTDDVKQSIWKAIDQVPSYPVFDDRIGGWSLADALDCTFNRALERRRRALTAFEVPENAARASSIELGEESHRATSPRENAGAGLGPGHRLRVAALEPGESTLGFLDPGALDPVGGLANAVEQA
jgi:hypothetical protein